jgi:peptidoglycan hydrolase-like protein with peptidoglycan-binding domain
MSARRLAALLAALAVIGIAAASCGGGDDSQGASTGIEGLLTETIGEAPPATEAAPPPPPPPAIRLVLVKGEPIGPGSKGAHVTALQKALVVLGYEVGKVDGRFGPKLSDAIAKFQKKHKLTADGVAGKKTIKAVKLELAKQAPG